MRVLVIGATGTIGAEVARELEASHEVVRASRRGDPAVDLANRDSIAALFARVRDVDAVVCCAASAPLTPVLDEGFLASCRASCSGRSRSSARRSSTSVTTARSR